MPCAFAGLSSFFSLPLMTTIIYPVVDLPTKGPPPILTGLLGGVLTFFFLPLIFMGLQNMLQNRY